MITFRAFTLYLLNEIENALRMAKKEVHCNYLVIASLAFNIFNRIFADFMLSPY